MPLGNFTDIIVLLDRSASMLTIAEPTRGGLNAFIEKQKANPGEARFTLAQFSAPGDFKYTYQAVPLGAVPDVTTTTFNPMGKSTALRDALHRLIGEVGKGYAAVPESNRPNQVVFVIVTDGQENSSVAVSREVLAEAIRLQSEAYKWQFIYLGANQDAILAAEEMAMPMAMAANYSAFDEQSVMTAYITTSDKIGDYRSTRDAASLNFTAEDRAKIMNKDKK